MPSTNYKFGQLDADQQDIEFHYSNCWALEKTSGPDRIAMAPASGCIALIERLAAVTKEPFGVLYVLVIPRNGTAGRGRYLSPNPISSGELHTFLQQFQGFFENDGRHHLWVASTDKSAILVYDRHNVIYAYGLIESFAEVLEASGLCKTDVIRFPDPHVHHYNAEFDEEEKRLLAYWPWKAFPLQETDEQ
jgi:hypothetical protein